MAGKTVQGTVTLYKTEFCPLIIERGDRNGNPAIGLKYTEVGTGKVYIYYLGIETTEHKLYIQPSVDGTIGNKVFLTDTIPNP